MKKRLFLLFCGVMCLFFALCSCGDGDSNPSGGSSSSLKEPASSQSGTPSNNSSSSMGSEGNDEGGEDDNKENGDISSPETECKLNSAGHLWSEVSINKNTSASGTVAISGKCSLCGDSLHKVCTALVDYNQWKSALSPEGLSSFTEVAANEYTDYGENGCMSWRVDENGTYTVDYFLNSEEKSSSYYANKFKGFSLQYEDFKYDGISKTYVLWISDKSYIELGFADGNLISHSACTQNGDREEKTTTLYLNHQRIKVEFPEFIKEKFDNALSPELLKSSNIGTTLAEGVYGELSKLNFDGQLEISMLENDRVSIYFYLASAGKCPVSGESYSTASVVIDDGKIIKVEFGSTSLELKYS